MTRFQLSSSSNYDDYGSPSQPTPPTSGGNPLASPPFGGISSSSSSGGAISTYLRISSQTGGGGGGANRNSPSVRLMTCSPDGKSIHSLIRGSNHNRFLLESHKLPLQEPESRRQQQHDEDDDDDDDELPTLIRTVLPDDIQEALQIDPPIELICMEGESRKHNKNHQDGSSTKKKKYLPQLCLYTQKSAFVLQLGYSKSHGGMLLSSLSPSSAFSGAVGSSPTRFGTPVIGTVESIREPFDVYLGGGLSSVHKTIVRIRSPPPSHDSIAVTPTGCMAALIYNQDANEYSILLHHADGTITVPAEWRGSEEILELEASESIIDFCFAKSSGLALFPSMSILLLKGSGEVLAVSPIVFDGTVVARSFVEEGLDYLQALQQTLERSSAKFRQYKAAEQYLLDVFNVRNQPKRRPFYTARVLAPPTAESAAIWPVAIQGPIVIQNIDENVGPTIAVALETFGSTDHFAGIAIAKKGYEVDFAVLSPTSLVPRFAFESITDSYELNDALYHLSTIVERVGLNTEGEANGGLSLYKSNVALISDPISNHLLHYVTSSCICTVSTNIMKITSRRLTNETIRDPIRTTAWSSLNTSSLSKAAIIGMTISSDSQMGHELVARLADGSIEQVKITETQYLHELNTIMQEAKEDNNRLLLTNSTSSGSSEISTVPLYEKIEPLVKRVTNGLGNMSKIVGTETSYKDIKPDALAGAIKLKEKCDKEVVLPLLELKKVVDTRRQHLKSIIESQQKQLLSLKKKVDEMKSTMNEINSQTETAQGNAVTLTERSKALLQASNDLLPTITQAEYEYFQDMKRLTRKVTALHDTSMKLATSVQKRCKIIEKHDVVAKLEPNTLETANKILKGEEIMLDRSRKALREQKKRAKELLRVTGLAAN